jgi:hypothetical protein
LSFGLRGSKLYKRDSVNVGCLFALFIYRLDCFFLFGWNDYTIFMRDPNSIFRFVYVVRVCWMYILFGDS